MTDNPKVVLLQRQIDAGKRLDLERLEYWRIRSENALRFTVGDESPALKKFRGVSYNAMGPDFGRSDRQAREAAQQRHGIEMAIVYLEYAIDELQLYDELLALQGKLPVDRASNTAN